MKYFMLALLILLAACKKPLLDQPASPSQEQTRMMKQASSSEQEETFKTGEVLVKFKNGQPSGNVKQKIRTRAMEQVNDPGFHILSVPDVSNAVQALKNNPNVEWVSPNYKVKPTYAPNDPYFTSGQLWGMNNIKVPQVWSSGNIGNQNIFVAVIDAGVYFNHPDLCGQIWNNPHDPVDGIDNDGNGYIDDHNGWDFFNKDRSVTDPNDNHGTHVSGTIAGKGNNGIGVVGVAPQATIIPVKFLDGFYGGYTSDAILALDYVTDLKTRHNLNIIASNNSWGGGGYNQGLRDAIERSKNANILFIAAAGNSGANLEMTNFYPAGYDNDNIISVAATNSSDQLASFSNYGAQKVDLGAPGQDVISTILANFATTSFGYSSYSGTSMAAPHVTGAAVLYKNANPSATWLQIKNAILSSVRPIPALTGKTLTGGTLDVSSFTGTTSPIQGNRSCVITDNKPPSKIIGLYSSNITATSFRLDWQVPTDDYGAFSYRVYRKLSTSTTWNFDQIATPAWVLSNLISGATYNIYVVAYDYSGNASEPSDILSVTTLNAGPDSIAPSKPTVTIGNTTSSSIPISWSASTDNVGVAGYTISYRVSGTVNYTHLTFGNVLSYTLGSLPASTQYDIYVTARDAAGNVASSNIVNAATKEPPPPPPPTVITSLINAGSTKTNHQLSYSVSTNGTLSSVVLQLKQDNGAYQTIQSATTLLGSFTNTVLDKGKYTYRIIATLVSGQQSTSTEVVIQNRGK
jgi:subtilisin family serine protease